MTPFATIAIPTLGRIEFLRAAIASARAQADSEIEILVGDNSADPETRAAISECVRGQGEIKVVVQPSRLPMAAHWNALADAATGEYFALLADDDLLEPEFVARLRALGRTAPEAGVLFSDHWIIDEGGKIDPTATAFYSEENGRADLAVGEVANSAQTVWRSSVPICACLVKTDLVRKHRFNADLNTPEIEFFARLAAEGVRFAYLPDRLARYRVHTGSETQAIGLRNGQLFRALRGIQVPAGAEPARRSLLTNLLVTAVTDAYRSRDMATVREFLGDPLYPRNPFRRPVACLQKFWSAFPDGFSPRAFVATYSVLRAIRGKRL